MVAVGIPSCALNFQVFPDHIETEAFGRLNVINHRLIGRRRVEAFRPITLVEDTVLEIRLSV